MAFSKITCRANVPAVLKDMATDMAKALSVAQEEELPLGGDLPPRSSRDVPFGLVTLQQTSIGGLYRETGQQTDR